MRHTVIATTLPYLLHDQFTTAQSAPITSPRACEPGPGTLTVLDTGNHLSIASGELVNVTPAGSLDPRLYTVGFPRAAGLAIYARLYRNGLGYMRVGFGAASDGNNGVSVHLIGLYTAASTFLWSNGGSVTHTFPGLPATGYMRVAIILRSAGALYFAALDAGPWQLVWVGSLATNSPMYPLWANGGAPSQDVHIDRTYIRKLSALSNDFALATSRLAGNQVVNAAYTHTADALIQWTVTTLQSSGNSSIIYRRVDANNNWFIQWSSTGTISIVQRLVGATTIQATSAAGLVLTGSGITITVVGNVHTVWVGTGTAAVTFTDAANLFLAATDGRVNVLAAGAAVQDIVAWPRFPVLPPQLDG